MFFLITFPFAEINFTSWIFLIRTEYSFIFVHVPYCHIFVGQIYCKRKENPKPKLSPYDDQERYTLSIQDSCCSVCDLHKEIVPGDLLGAVITKVRLLFSQPKYEGEKVWGWCNSNLKAKRHFQAT